jgi:DegV family protein with EDD domain
MTKKPVCILTDSTAQFIKPFPDPQSLIEVIPLTTSFNDGMSDFYPEGPNGLPQTADDKFQPRLIPPSVEEYINYYIDLGKRYEKLLGIFLSSRLNPACDNALKAAEMLQGKVVVEVIDSQTTSIGLGYLVQHAFDFATKGIPPGKIERMIRIMVQYVYSVLCFPDLSYLYHAGFVEKAQSVICGRMGIQPIFTLENGILTPLDKVKNPRQASLYFQEFIEEFDEMQNVTFLHPSPRIPQESALIREYVQSSHSKTHFHEMDMNLHVAGLLGPQSYGLFINENPNPKHI